MHFRTFSAAALSLAAFTALALPASAQTIPITGLSPGAQAIWNKCADVTSRMMRQQMTLMHIGADEEANHIRPGLEAFAASDKAKVIAGVESMKQPVTSSDAQLTNEFYGCLGDARVAQIDGTLH